MRFLVFIAALFFPFAAQAEDNDLVVIELFTSQSCSSCPPADAFLGELAQQKNILALGCHVTYWNHLSWRDTQSIEACTDHQKRFNRLTGIGRVYTPQMVVNGKYEDVGSRKRKINEFIRKARKDDDLIQIDLTLNDDVLNVSFPEKGRMKDPLDVMLLAYDGTHTEDIKRGENWGREMTYTHPVQHLVPLDPWNGYESTQEIYVGDFPVNGGYAVLARKNRSGEIIAAGDVKLP